MRTRAAPPHPIILLVTDGEEAGLLGALLFVREHPLAKHVSAAVNMDSRGVSGASLMFETGTANISLMHLYAAAARRPVTNSLFYVVYKALPNDTDFTVFKAAPYQGLISRSSAMSPITTRHWMTGLMPQPAASSIRATTR